MQPLAAFRDRPQARRNDGKTNPRRAPRRCLHLDKLRLSWVPGFKPGEAIAAVGKDGLRVNWVVSKKARGCPPWLARPRDIASLVALPGRVAFLKR